MPPFVEFGIASTEPGVRGDSSSGSRDQAGQAGDPVSRSAFPSYQKKVKKSKGGPRRAASLRAGPEAVKSEIAAGFRLTLATGGRFVRASRTSPPGPGSPRNADAKSPERLQQLVWLGSHAADRLAAGFVHQVLENQHAAGFERVDDALRYGGRKTQV